MVLRLSTSDKDFGPAFAALLAMKREVSEDVDEAVRDIIATVRAKGDAALVDYTAQWDGLALTPETLRVSDAEIADAAASVRPQQIAALEMAAARIWAFHGRQKPVDLQYTDEQGVRLGARWTPVAAAGLYVPGGKAAYPSSVLMNAIPAQVAGVARIAMAVPCPGGELNPLVMAAARLLGIAEVYRIGGAQAVAAFAYGTPAIAPVDVIAGPGNAYVAAAKRRVFGAVGIDMIAGPSEILVVADGSNDPAWIAADLLSQAEHDESSQSILITDDAAFGDAVAAEVERQLGVHARAEIPRASWAAFGAIVTVASLDEVPVLVDALAPEHLELAVEAPDALAAKISNAGAIFLGRHTPEAIGDYVAGPNHVLPTARSARFSSGLSVTNFMKRTSLVSCTPEALAAIGPAAVTLAETEGLPAHARSVALRINSR
jgi:histidinol dehydrogenase